MKKILLFLLILNQFVFSAVSEDKIDYVFGAAADKYNIDPKVIAAVAYYESRLYPNIVSILTKSRYKKNIVEKYLKKHNYKYKKHKRRFARTDKRQGICFVCWKRRYTNNRKFKLRWSYRSHEL